MRHWSLMVVITACSSPQPRTAAPEKAPRICSGQTADSTATATTAREGAMPLQLAPSFLDRMDECTRQQAVPRRELVHARAGVVNTKGDCEWSTGVTCHFHRGAEFVESSAPRPNVGELHCIFPTNEPKNPRVYGMHFTCKPGGAISHEHAVREQQACGASLLVTLAATMDQCHARCCDNGTLTNPLDDRQQTDTLDVRPDFAICAATVELDCGVFADMIGHTANAPRFGAPIEAGI